MVPKRRIVVKTLTLQTSFEKSAFNETQLCYNSVSTRFQLNSSFSPTSSTNFLQLPYRNHRNFFPLQSTKHIDTFISSPSSLPPPTSLLFHRSRKTFPKFNGSIPPHQLVKVVIISPLNNFFLIENQSLNNLMNLFAVWLWFS
jgi:hypothetical protein